MSTEDLLIQLRRLPPGELRQVLRQIGYVPATSDAQAETSHQNGSKKGLTLGLLRGTFTYIAEDFDAELPESFWSGDEDVA